MDYFGPDVNKAARVAGRTKAGQILITESTLTRRCFSEGYASLIGNVSETPALRSGSKLILKVLFYTAVLGTRVTSSVT